jgi:hypothetical protein
MKARNASPLLLRAAAHALESRRLVLCGMRALRCHPDSCKLDRAAADLDRVIIPLQNVRQCLELENLYE